ncbi:MAG: YeeE/YedE family protein [Acidiferrobacteraceae bacterium]
MFNYWPWWIGAPALGAIPILFWLLFRRPLGVSGSWGQLTSWRATRGARAVATSLRRNPAVMSDALMAATMAQFGNEVALGSLNKPGTTQRPAVTARTVTRARVPVTAHLAFLVSLALGGLLSLMPDHTIRLHFSLSPAYTVLFGTGWTSWLVLLSGGTLVGFGTQMAGGCTSGHGLIGCATLRPASLVATMTFFGSAVATSWLLEALLK